MAWPPSHALQDPLERGGLTFVQNPSNCLESKRPKCFTPTWRGRQVTPYKTPSKEGALPLYKILATAWSLSIQSVLHRQRNPDKTAGKAILSGFSHCGKKGTNVAKTPKNGLILGAFLAVVSTVANKSKSGYCIHQAAKILMIVEINGGRILRVTDQ